jgi:hypothetical protein
MGATGLEPSFAAISAAFRSHRARVELAPAIRSCVTDQASLTVILRGPHMGNVAHPMPTLVLGGEILSRLTLLVLGV